MNYEAALKLWGMTRIEQAYRVGINPDTVTVRFDFKEGYACCGGRNPDCYCSFAESPSANVVIEGRAVEQGGSYSYWISADEFDLAEVVKEIVIAGGGKVEVSGGGL